MEDVHVIHPPNTWAAPHPSASFIGVYDGHGGRLIVDYLEDHLSKNVAQEWRFESGQKCDDNDGERGNVGHDGVVAVGRKRRLSTTTDGDENDDDKNHDSDDEGVEEEEKELFCNTCFRGGIPFKVASTHIDGCPDCPSLTPKQIEYYTKHPEQAREMQLEVDIMMIDNKLNLEKRRKKQAAAARR